MAKSVLLDVLEKTIGKYVLNLDANSLNVAFWSGKIELNQLQLDTKAINFELSSSSVQPPIPFRVQWGQFDHFQVQVPWAHLMSKPVVAQAQGLRLTIVPYHHLDEEDDENDDFVADNNNNDSDDQDNPKNPPRRCKSSSFALDAVTDGRLRSLDNAEEYRQQANALRQLAEEDLNPSNNKDDDKALSSSSSSTSFAAKLVRRIVENMQVEISNVHIVLETPNDDDYDDDEDDNDNDDDGNNSSRRRRTKLTSAAGIQLESLKFETTDANGQRTFVDRIQTKDSFLYKRLEIRGLGIYMDNHGYEEDGNGQTKSQQPRSSKGHHKKNLSSIQEQSNDNDDEDNDDDDNNSDSPDDRAKVKKKKDSNTIEDDLLEHDYVLAPLSLEAKLRQADSNVCLTHAKYMFQSNLQSLNILLSKPQVQLAHKIGLLLDNSNDQGQALVPLFPEYRPAVRLYATLKRRQEQRQEQRQRRSRKRRSSSNSGNNNNQRLLSQPQRTSSSSSHLGHYPPTSVSSGVGESPAKQWWKYAVRCVGRLNGQRLWVEFFRAFQKRKQYIPLYKRKMFHCNRDAELEPFEKSPTKNKKKKQKKTESVACHWLKPLTPEEETKLHEIELDRSISTQGIMMWRSIAEAQVQKEREKHEKSNNNNNNKKAKTSTSLFTSLFGSSSKPTTNDDVGDESDEGPPIALSPQELKELEEMATAEQQQEQGKVENSESKLLDVQFVLNSFQVNLTTYQYTALTWFQMGQVSTSFQSNANGSFQFHFSLRSLTIDDKITTNSFFPTVLKNQPRQQKQQLLLPKSNDSNDDDDNDDKAFAIDVNRTKTGDSHLKVHLSTFEAIASPNWVKEMKRFFSVQDGIYTTVGGDGGDFSGSSYLKTNPILTQSLSGSVDLFYDAAEGAPTAGGVDASTSTTASFAQQQFQRSLRTAKFANSSNAAIRMTQNTKAVQDNLSNALFDAWKTRTETRSTWLMDLDLQAPILVVPESSTNPQANVLVFDLGHLQMAYGSRTENDKKNNPVKQWFKANPKVVTKTEREPILDHGNMQISSLSFLIGRVNDWKKFVKKHDDPSNNVVEQQNAIVEPITVSLKLGVEASASQGLPRVCAFAVLPTISVAVSPAQVARIVNVYQAWNKLLLSPSQRPQQQQHADAAASVGDLGNLGAKEDRMNQSNLLLEPDTMSMSSAGSRMLERAHKLTMSTIKAAVEPAKEGGAAPRKFKQIHVDVKLQQFSVQLRTADDSTSTTTASTIRTGMETHLVSVGSSLTVMSNGVTSARLKMGWFWILDNLYNNFARTQRLLVHSNLPVSASELALGSNYDILSKLKEIGALDLEDQTKSYRTSSSDLADISIVCSPDSSLGSLDPFLEHSLSSSADHIAANAVVDATFSSLYLNWNPRAIPQVLDELTLFTKCMDIGLNLDSNKNNKQDAQEQSTVILPSPENRSHPSRAVDDITMEREEDDPKKVGKDDVTQPFCIVGRARMESVNLCLRSARDDLPIFTFTMSSADASAVATTSDDILLRASLGNVSITTPTMGLTHSKYRTMLGLSPGKSDSLLSVIYVKGDRAMSKVDDQSLQKASDLGAWALVTISPMRLVHIQAQVLALLEYATAGILGTLTKQFASSAAVAAAEMVKDSEEKQLFVVRATGFEVLLPENAYEERYCSISTGAFSAEYTVLSEEKGGEAEVSIHGIMISDPHGIEMLDEPLEMKMSVVLPMAGIGSLEDQAMRVKMSMSSASFLLLKSQYQQMMATLEKNIQETDLFLRENDSMQQHATGDDADDNNKTSSVVLPNLTHAGVLMVQAERPMFVDLVINSLSLDLMGQNVNDSIIRLKADRALIRMESRPKEQRLSAKISLRDLVCWDERPEAIGRNERALVSQDNANDPEQQFFDVTYEKTGQSKMEVGLQVGSPRMVFIPDAISEILGFLKIDDDTNKNDGQSNRSGEEINNPDQTEFSITQSESGDAIEVEALPVGSSNERTMVFSLNTRQCSVVLVDLGGNALTGQVDGKSSVKTTSVTETVVLRGMFDAKGSFQTGATSFAVKSASTEMHGDDVEIFTALGGYESSIQILDPFSFSVYGNARGMDTSSRSFDLRLAVLSPIDMCISMRNFALMNTILDSIMSSNLGSLPEEEDVTLSSQEAQKLEILAETLERKDTHRSESSESIMVTTPIETDLAGPAGNTASKSSMNITLPEAKITIVNDLQGLDDALIRFDFRNLVTNVQVREGERITSNSDPYTGFDGSLNCTIGADYFDNSEGIWKDFFMKPWEITIRGGRGPNIRLKTNRPSTYVDVESFPCHISFSEEFLFSLASANRMWSVYSMATSSLLQSVVVPTPPHPSITAQSGNEKRSITDGRSGTANDLRRNVKDLKASSLKRSMAATAARTLITALPFALENNSGFDIEFKIVGSDGKLRSCANGSIEYFRFPPPKSKGTGGKRLYGQDVKFEKQLSVRILKSWFEINHIGDDIGTRRVHSVQDSQILISQILKEGKTTVIHISSGVDIHGKTSIPIEIRMPCLLPGGYEGVEYVGACGSGKQSNQKLSIFQDGKYNRASSRLGLPLDKVLSQREEWKKNGSLTCSIIIVPNIPLGNDQECELRGDLRFTLDQNAFRGSGEQQILQTEAVCRPMSRNGGGSQVSGVDSFVLQVRVVGRLVEQIHPCFDVFLEPRALIENKLPIPITIRTPMPQTYSTKCTNDEKATTHELDPDKAIEIYTLSQSIAISVKCADNPVGGTPTGWIDGNWADLPLKHDCRLLEPQRCLFPFTSYSGNEYSIPGGSQFFIADGVGALSVLADLDKSHDDKGVTSVIDEPLTEEVVRTFFVTLFNYAVDHTGEILFGLVEDGPGGHRRGSLRHSSKTHGGSVNADPTPVGAFKSNRHQGRVSLLPESQDRVQLIHLTMEGDHGMRKSQPFYIEEVSICDGGVNSTPIHWEDGKPSGFFTYRKLINTYQSEIHVVPEFIVFNGSKKYNVRVRQRNGIDTVIQPGKIVPLRRSAQEDAIISISWLEFDGVTAPLSVDRLGLRVAIVRTQSGLAIGSLAIQTVVGSNDSRLVVKLADIRLGSEARQSLAPRRTENMLDNDFLRFRAQWSELKLTLKEAKPVVEKKKAYLEYAFDNIATQQGADPKTRYTSGQTSQVGKTWTEARNERNEDTVNGKNRVSDTVCTLVLQQFTVDWQRVFKEDPKPSALRSDKERLQSQERSQFSLIIHKIRLTDETPDSVAPLVLDCSSDNASFFDLCIRVKGPLDAELVNVDLFDLNLAFKKGKNERIILSTSESFAWKLLDLGDQILAAASEISGFSLDLEWDENHGGYKVQLKDSTSYAEEGTRYTPPNSEKLFDIRAARVSPFVVLLSFDRTPVRSKYSPVRTGQNAALMNYFTQRLQFKIDRAELKFAKYEASHIKGPADRVVEIISTVYMSRMKLKFVTLMTAMSLQDWKYLAARSGGEDEFMDGDIVRVAGNLAGNTVNYVLKGSGRGIESILKRGSSSLGAGIENAANRIGVGAVGSGMNSVVTGVGGGVGEAVSGVGSGAGHLVKGVGRGFGHVIGGVTGGATMMVKGTAKGITSGDGRAVASSVADGARSVGSGVGQGVSSVVSGTADGFYSVGKGIFSGVRSVGKGMVGAVRMKKKSESDQGGDEAHRTASPSLSRQQSANRMRKSGRHN